MHSVITWPKIGYPIW